MNTLLWALLGVVLAQLSDLAVERWRESRPLALPSPGEPLTAKIYSSAILRHFQEEALAAQG